MEAILSQNEAEEVLDRLSESEKAEIERDKIRFGEYYIRSENDRYQRVDPINVIVKNGVPELVQHASLTFI